VLGAVTALLHEVGYQDLTVEAVAARAGVGKTTVYRWWPTKPVLVIDAIADTLPQVEVELSGETRRDVRKVLVRLAHVDTAAPLTDAMPALATEARRDPAAAERLAALLGPRRAADAAVLLAATARGDLPHDVDVPLLLDVAFGTLLLRRLRGEEPTDDVLDALTDLLVGPR
jgi:AcrR family transcriptional regulator